MAPDPHEPAETHGPASVLRPGATVLALAAVTALAELVLTGADHGLWGTPLWRPTAYHYGAFWAGLLDNWQPNFPLQPVTMFLSYAFLHSGPGHLLGNLAVLLVLGPLVVARFGAARMLAIYGASILAGGIGFAVLGESYQPMVGASGALFGLAGAWEAAAVADARTTGSALWPVARDIAGLVLLNLVSWIMLDGVVAWQAHLGGFLGGAAMAAVLLRTETGGGPGGANASPPPPGDPPPPSRSAAP